MTTVLTINKKVLEGLELLRKDAEDVCNWRYVGDVNDVTLTRIGYPTWDVLLSFNWVVDGGVVMRYLSLVDKRATNGSPIPVDYSLAFTLAHHLGYSGGEISAMGSVRPGKTWKAGHRKSTGEVIIQQPVQKLCEA